MASSSFARAIGAGGGNPFGSVPSPIAVPPNIYAQTAGVVPNLDALAKGAGAFAGSELAGQLSPETINAIQDEGAAWGVQSGMPGSGLAQNRSLRNLGLNVEAIQHQGVGDFLSTLTGIGKTMTDPGLAAEISNRNSVFAAAPNPAAAAAEMERQWMEKFNLTRGAGGRSLNWAQLYGSAPNVNPGGGSRFGTGSTSFIGGFDPGAGGAPEVGPFGALGPFETPAKSSATYTLTGNTYGGGPARAPHDEVLDAFFNPEDYVWNQPGEDQTQTSGGD
jgi:hypothetical protein